MILCDKRYVKRFDMFLIAECRPVNMTKEFSVGITRNLSTEGFSMETQSFDRTSGDILEFSLKHPHRDFTVIVSGKVVWKHYSWYKYIVGVKYIGLSEEQNTQMHELVSSVNDEINMNDVYMNKAVNSEPERCEKYFTAAGDSEMRVDCLSGKKAPSPVNELIIDEEVKGNVRHAGREQEKEEISTFQQRTDKVYHELMKRLPKEESKKPVYEPPRPPKEENAQEAHMTAPRNRAVFSAEKASPAQKVINRKSVASGKKEHLPEKATLLLGKDTVVLPQPKLVIIDGKDLGREFELDKDELCIGRSADNHIVLNDPMVSRRHHARLIRNQDASWTIEDLGSTNGVFVSGKKVGKSLLSSKEEIKIGATLFRFVKRGEDFTPAKRSRENKQKIGRLNRVPTLVLVAVPVLFILLVALFAFPGNRETGEKRNSAPFFKGKTVQKEKHMNVHPDVRRPFPKAKSWSRTVDERARESVDDHQNAVAAGVVQEESASLQRKAEREDRLVKREQAEAYVAEGKEMVKNKNYREAIEKYQMALNMDSENEEAKVLIEETKKEYKRSALQKSKKRKNTAQAKLDVALISNALDFYSEGNVDKAISILRVIQTASDSREQASLAETYIGSIKRVEKSYWKGSDYYNAEDTAEAFREWTKTLAYEKELPLKSMSWHSRKIAGLAALERYKQ